MKLKLKSKAKIAELRQLLEEPDPYIRKHQRTTKVKKDKIIHLEFK